MLSFFNGLNFKVELGERVLPIDELVKEEYAGLLEGNTVQIPLYRYLKAKDYRIFIGIPYEISFEKLVDFQLKNTILIEKQEGESFIYKKYQKGNYYISEYVYQKGKNLLMILGVTSLKEDIKFLSKENLSNRIKNIQDEK